MYPAYTVAIGLLALAISVGALWPSEESGMGVMVGEPVQEAPADAEPDCASLPGISVGQAAGALVRHDKRVRGPNTRSSSDVAGAPDGLTRP